MTGTVHRPMEPAVIVGTAPLTKPGKDPAHAAITALASIHDRGHPAKWIAADLLYPHLRPETFQLPARALGYQPVFDYREDQLGKQGSYAGAIQVEGGWYCPSLPATLINATIDYRAGTIDDNTYQARLAERAEYRMRPKSRPDPEGHVRLICPAAGNAPSARCPLKASSYLRNTQGKLLIQVSPDVQAQPPKVCTQQSAVFPPNEGAAFAQDLQYGTAAWREAYHVPRNTIEGANGFVKDAAFENLEDGRRRRVRGIAAQSLFAALLIFTANVRKIEGFLEHAQSEPDGTTRRRRKPRRATKPLSDYLPANTLADTG